MQQDNIDTKKIWHEVLENIKVSVSPAIYNTWFVNTFVNDFKNSQKRAIAEIGCPSTFVKTTIEARYFGMIQDALSSSIDKPCDLVFVVKEPPQASSGIEMDSPLFAQAMQSQNKIIDSRIKSARARAHLTFENYAVGSSNQMAWAAAEAVSKNPGSAYNPLFIWGGVGVGKTHLMNAVGVYLLNKNPDNKVYFCTGEDFTNDIVEGIRNKTTQEFRNKYRKLNLLMIDDIQFIAGKDAVQEEFFHTFNALVSAGGQVILTSDRPPSEIQKLEERLKSRFEAGLIVDIAQPDFELRCAIIQIKSKERGVNLDMESVQIIAGNIDSARKIEGFLTKILSENTSTNDNDAKETVERLLSKGEGEPAVMIKASPGDLITAVCKYFSIGKRALLGSSRARAVSMPRQILMYLLRTQLQLPLEEVGRVVGGRDHTTVMHAVEKITHSASNNVQVREDIKGIKNSL